MNKTRYLLSEIAQHVGAALQGCGDASITNIAPLTDAGPSDISFLSNPRYLKQLSKTRAGAVLLSAEYAKHCPVPALLVSDPYLAYATVSHWFDNLETHTASIHVSAAIDPSVQQGRDVSIGANVVIAGDCVLGDNVVIGANTVIGERCQIGSHSVIRANVTLYSDVIIGQRVSVHSGTVIGSDGFGYANDQGRWHKIAQLGGVTIGDDVEIGACVSIDRGALNDTVVESGVIIDNQVQLAHNVRVGANTAIAGCVGVAGSTHIGAGCTIAGAAGLAGHLRIADNVHIGMQAQVTNSLHQAGSYSSGTGLLPTRQWRRLVVRWRQLDRWAKTAMKLQKQWESLSGRGKS